MTFSLPTNAGSMSFANANTIYEHFSKAELLRLAHQAGDFLLLLDADGAIRDLTVHTQECSFVRSWIGEKWMDIVTVESRPKIEAMLHSVPGDAVANWRQVNHPQDGDDIPISYGIVRSERGSWSIAIGRDLRPLAIMQQRLLRTQQSMERDYLNLRQTETRYRLLFDAIAHPVLIVEAGGWTIDQANRAATSLFGTGQGPLDQKNLLALFARENRDQILGYFGAVAANTAVPSISVKSDWNAEPLTLSASTFRQNGRQYWLIHLTLESQPIMGDSGHDSILDVVERMPDAFILTDEKQAIISANRAFVDLVQASSSEQILGTSLSRFVGRPDVDLSLIKKQLKDHQHVRNFSSIIRDLNGLEEPVEISAILVERHNSIYGYAVRSIGRRERALPVQDQGFPKSVDQLTDLVGRKKLKDIVRESTDLIERMCIEAALVHTADNRASAAEILGLSRQSLYSKLHRHKLGNLDGRE